MSYDSLHILLELIRKSGVREWEEAGLRVSMAQAAAEMAAALTGESNVALPDYLKMEPGTAKTIKASAGDAAISLASLANGNGTTTGARQAATLDLGAQWAQWWRVDTEFELAATPTDKALIHIYGSFQNASGAGTGNTSGSDASYTGYSSNNLSSLQNHLWYLGDHVCTVQATPTVQDGRGFLLFPKGRYLNVVVYNASGAAFHSSDTNCVIRLTPLEQRVQDTV